MVVVIGAGLAGSEAALQIASRGVPVELWEMRPSRMTEAHTSGRSAELVCSNSFGSTSPHSSSSILKEELSVLGASILEVARQFAVPAGASLAVDRELFSQRVTDLLAAHPLISRETGEIREIPKDRISIIATGPLTSPDLAQHLTQKVGQDSLYFYDAISPIVSAESLDLEQMYFANRYDKGETKDFLNIPLTQEQYDTLVEDLLMGDVVLPHNFEEEKYFEACMPIEALASRGRQTLAFGPMKPVGLNNPRDGKRPYAVIQLRAENQYKTAYNLVGFQTKLKYKEQERIFRKLPGLGQAEFLRLGSMHRNTYLHSPRTLLPTLQLKCDPNILVAGQLTGTEGYLESTATGWLAAWNAVRLHQGLELSYPPAKTMLGALTRAITDPARVDFQPMNSNMGVLPPLETRQKDKKLRNAALSERSQSEVKSWWKSVNEAKLLSVQPCDGRVDPERPAPIFS